MNEEMAKELIEFFCNQLASALTRSLGVTAGTGKMETQPGALEVVADALGGGTWTPDGGIASNIYKLSDNAESVSQNISKLADSVDKLADRVGGAGSNIADALLEVSKSVADVSSALVK